VSELNEPIRVLKGMTRPSVIRLDRGRCCEGATGAQSWSRGTHGRSRPGLGTLRGMFKNLAFDVDGP